MSTELLRIGELARRSGVPVATLKYYVREGLIEPVRKSGPTMSWYAGSTVARIAAIKELQQQRYLPLDVIKRFLAKSDVVDDDMAVGEAITNVLARHVGERARSRAELLERGVTMAELDWLASAGLAVPGADGMYRDDDLALLTTLEGARRSGLVAEMLPFATLGEYLSTIHRLVTVELSLYRAGVAKREKAGDLERLTAAAAELSERLVVLIRRKLLLPTLRRMLEEETRTSERPADFALRRVTRPATASRAKRATSRRGKPTKRTR